MDIHKNAPLTPKGRGAMVRIVIEGGLTKAAAARQFNTTAKTVAKWVERFRTGGVDGLCDRSSKPHSLPSHVAKWLAGRICDSPSRSWQLTQVAGQKLVRSGSVATLAPALPASILSTSENFEFS